MSDTTPPLIINGFDQGIGDSPHKGFGLMKLVDIDKFPGSAAVGKKLATLFPTALSTTFTADPATDICTITTGTLPPTGYPIATTSTGTIPAGLDNDATIIRFIIKLSATTFKVASSVANADASTAIDITSAGSGTHTVITKNPAQINHFVQDRRAGSQYFMIDSSGYVWHTNYGTSARMLMIGNTPSNASGNGLALLHNSAGTATYLFIFRNRLIDVVNVFGTTELGAPSVSSSWQTMNSAAGVATRHKAILGQDNIIYYTDGQYIGTIRELPNQVFDPATATTYQFNSQALDFPYLEVTTDIEELGLNLLISGTTFGRIYPWDRFSDSYQLPLSCPEPVFRMKNLNGIVYLLTGRKGHIYRTQGSYVEYFTKIPMHLGDNLFAGGLSPMTWGACEAFDGNLMVGVATTTSGNSGLYKITPEGRITLDQIPSTGTANVVSMIVNHDFTSSTVSDSEFLIGYSGGADYFTGALYSTNEGVIQSQLYRVATKSGKASYHQLEISLGATTGANVIISYRTSLTASWTTLTTFTMDGTNTTFSTDIGLIDIENIQIQAELDGTGSGHDLELLEIRLLP